MVTPGILISLILSLLGKTHKAKNDDTVFRKSLALFLFSLIFFLLYTTLNKPVGTWPLGVETNKGFWKLKDDFLDCDPYRYYKYRSLICQSGTAETVKTRTTNGVRGKVERKALAS